MTDLISILRQLQIDEDGRGYWYLSWPDGSRFDSTLYGRSQDAKRERTMLIKRAER